MRVIQQEGRQCRVLSHCSHLFLPWLCRAVLQLAQEMRCMGPQGVPLPAGTWHTPGAGLGITVPIYGPRKQELCSPGLSLAQHWGLMLAKQQPWQGTATGNRATPIFPALNCKQAPSPDSTSAPHLLNGACEATRDGSGWGCGQDCASPG